MTPSSNKSGLESQGNQNDGAVPAVAGLSRSSETRGDSKPSSTTIPSEEKIQAKAAETVRRSVAESAPVPVAFDSKAGRLHKAVALDHSKPLANNTVPHTTSEQRQAQPIAGSDKTKTKESVLPTHDISGGTPRPDKDRRSGTNDASKSKGKAEQLRKLQPRDQFGLEAIAVAAQRESSTHAVSAKPRNRPGEVRGRVHQKVGQLPTSTQPQHLKQKSPVTISPPVGPNDPPVSHVVMSVIHSPASAPSKPKTTTALRRGKWTVEEEAYVARVIQDFNSGYLNAPAGTTLRSYLSEKLHCDPMRITKKFTGDACIGKRVFHPAVRCPSNTAAIDKAQAELDALERRWRRRLEMQQRESAKKAAASAAAAAAASAGRSHLGGVSHLQSLPQVASTKHHVAAPHIKQHAVTRTASWLDRANAILSGHTGDHTTSTSSHLGHPQHQDHARAVRSMPPKEIEDQMKEVQRLIHEGPIIQQTTAGLPLLLENGFNQDPHHRRIQGDTSSRDSPTMQQPRDKRPRRHSGAEDAEALVGFLNSVRASAAAAASTESSTN